MDTVININDIDDIGDVDNKKHNNDRYINIFRIISIIPYNIISLLIIFYILNNIILNITCEYSEYNMKYIVMMIVFYGSIMPVWINIYLYIISDLTKIDVKTYALYNFILLSNILGIALLMGSFILYKFHEQCPLKFEISHLGAIGVVIFAIIAFFIELILMIYLIIKI